MALVFLPVFLALLSASLLSSSSLAATPAAEAPTPAPLNFTGILDKGGQYTTFLRLLQATQVGEQVTSQLNNSYEGLTIFAPTDNAFNNLKPGTLNSLSAQEQVQLILFHVIPRFYSFSSFQTASNPLRTQASGQNGVYTLNVTSSGQRQANVSTGVVLAPVNNVLYSTFPLAVYSVDTVLLPEALFGAKPPAPAPSADAKTKPKDKTDAAAGSSLPPAKADQADSTVSAAATAGGRLSLVILALLGAVSSLL